MNVIVNGRAIKVAANTTILKAITQAGARVPTLCYNERFPPKSTCRLCLVETNQSQKLVPACSTVITKEIEITTDSKQLLDYRKAELQLLLSRHPNECTNCMVNGKCQLQDHVNQLGVCEKWEKQIRGTISEPEHIFKAQDFSSPCIERDLRKCIECGLCVQACGELGQNINAIGFVDRGSRMLPVTVFDKPLHETNCIDCGQCTSVCPTGALVEHQDWKRVLRELDSKRKKLIVQTAPATRVAIGEEFGLEPGTISTGRLVTGLRELGFDLVFDTNFSADLTIMEESHELIERVTENKLPLMTSCCPGWINYVEKIHPELIPYLSTTKSPQQMHGALTRKFYGEDCFVVSIMPCTAKKGESLRPQMKGDIDAVLTTRELAVLFRARKVDFANLKNDSTYDSPLGESTGAAMIFGATGGVVEAALRTALFKLKIDAPIDFKSVRGFDKVKECHIENVGTVCAVNGISAVEKLFKENKDWYKKYVMIEVMACVGGCLGGGGEPKFLDSETLQKRMKGIYQIDSNAPKRKSHENKEIIKLYNDYLGKPLSKESEKYLHTKYYKRGSKREMLARFLSAVDRKDFDIIDLFEDDGVWITNSAFGTVNRDKILFLLKKLPKGRHRLAENEGMNVLDINDHVVTFDIELGPNKLIKRIERIAI